MENARLMMDDNRLKRILSVVNRPTVKVVSFDIFDTLITRKVWDPADVFVMMSRRADVAEIMSGERFDLVRREAERSVRLETEAKGQDPTLDAIYDRLSELCDLSRAQREQLIEIEQDIEVAVIVPRPPLQNVWRHVRRLGKEVILCSDMYLPRSVILRMLRGAGYDTSHRLFLSCELGVTKKHGTLFSFVAEAMGLAHGDFLHLGDNRHADVRMAEAAGWRALHIPKVRDRVFQSEQNALTGLVPAYRRTSEIRSFATGASLKLVAERLFSYRLESEVDAAALAESAEDFGYAALGPFLLSLALWMRRLAQARGQEHMLFLARDGWLPMAATRTLDDCLSPVFQSVYLPISRRMIFPWLLGRPGGFESIAGIGFRPGLSVEAYLTERFGVAGRTVFLEAAGAQGERLLSHMLHDQHALVLGILRDNQSRLRELSEPLAQRVEAFYRDAVPADSRVGLFDVGRKGTFQRVLSSITRRPLHGYYVVTSPDIHGNAPDRNFDAFLGMIDPTVRRRNPDTIAYEALLSERAGGYVGIGADGAPLRETPAENDDHIKRIHSGAMEYVRDAIATYGEDVGLLEQEPFYASYALENWSKNKGTAALFARLKHEDSISDVSARTLSEALRGADIRTRPDPRLLFPPRTPIPAQPRRDGGRFGKGAPSRRIALYCPAITSVRGGAERVTALLANHFSRAGHEVLVMCSGRAEASTVPVYDLDPTVLVRNVNARSSEDIAKVVAAFDPDIGAILASGPVIVRLGHAFVENGVPYIVSERADPAHSARVYWKEFDDVEYRAAHGVADLIAVQFPSFGQAFPDVAQERIVTLPNPVIARAHVEIGSEGGADGPPRENAILCPARIWFEQKRQDVLLEAFARIAEAHPDWCLRFFGNAYGDCADRLRARADDLGLGARVSVNPSTDRIEDEMARAKLFVLPSAFEGFPNALAEALASGLPAVGFAACAGVNELIRDTENGLLLDDTEMGEDEDSMRGRRIALLAEGLNRMMSDPDLLNRCAAGAPRSVASYEAERVFALWEAAFERLMTDPRPDQERKARLRALTELSVRHAVEEAVPLAEDAARFDLECAEAAQHLMRAMPMLRLRTRIRQALRLKRLGSDNHLLLMQLLARRARDANWNGAETFIPADFDEEAYRCENPDVRQAVEAGQLPSGYAHYLLYGFREGRPRPSKPTCA